MSDIKLHLGCGDQYLDGWVNIDHPGGIMKADVYSRVEDLNYDDSSVSEIYMSAVFEHFPRTTAIVMLRRFYKWLKQNGALHIRVPDFLRTVGHIISARDVRERQIWYRHLFGPQDTIEYGTHYDGYDLDKLDVMFRLVGFKKITYQLTDLQGKTVKWPYIEYFGKKGAYIKPDDEAHKDMVCFIGTNSPNDKGDTYNSWLNSMNEVGETMADIDVDSISQIT